jgi:hypothetical protein
MNWVVIALHRDYLKSGDKEWLPAYVFGPFASRELAEEWIKSMNDSTFICNAKDLTSPE